jgi:hypothetical protein
LWKGIKKENQMKFKLLKAIFVGAILTFTTIANAGLIHYNNTTDTWTYSDFAKTNIGNYIFNGNGELAGDGGTIIGGGSHFLWQAGTNGGGAGVWNWSSYTDYYFPSGYQVEVVGAQWTNLEARDINRGSGVLGLQLLNSTYVGASMAEGQKLDGVFTYDTSSGSATWSYKANNVDVPEPSTLAIFALGMIGLASRRFKKQS